MNQEMDFQNRNKIYSDMVKNRELEQMYLKEAIKKSNVRFEQELKLREKRRRDAQSLL